ncbi:Bax inhibitor-1 family protein [Akkermansiaceae bacterium]|nr:Bax inhibitor-1 family protein [Akkermansiaceae bacterium]MDB4725635.1 Bax inhibitor-1 family protein [Akkermansiaceae bacterium]
MNTQDIYGSPMSAAMAPVDARAAFIRRTYAHLAGSIAAFIILEAMLFSIPNIEYTVFSLLGKSSYSWLIVLGLFMFVSHLATKWANSSVSKTTQYLGLGLFIVAEAIIFLPLLLQATLFTGSSDLLAKAGVITIGLVAGITLIAFTTKKDFSFLGGILKVGGFVAIGVIVASTFIQGFNLGLWFSAIMVVFAGGSILHQTSNIIHHYRPDQHVAASLGLFASVALLFWYVLRILMSLTGRD